MTQEPYGDAESLLRAVLAELMRVAYGLLGNHADTEDAVQNSCVKLMTAWPRVAGLATPGEQRAYLFRIVLNEALQILRDPHRRWEHLGVDAAERAVTEHSFEDEIQAKEDLRLVWKAIGDLPDMRRDVVLLRAAGYEYQDIATRLGIKISTVRSHISDARKQLSRTLPRDWEGAQMSTGNSPDEHGDVLDWLYQQGKQRAAQVPGFDAEKLIRRARAARDAGAVNFWSALSPAERSPFESAAQLREFASGTALMREGEQAAAVMILLAGWTKVFLDEDGQERVITERGPGDLIGESGTEPGYVRTASVIALGRVQALVMTTADYTAFIDEFPNVPDLVKKQTYERRTGRP